MGVYIPPPGGPKGPSDTGKPADTQHLIRQYLIPRNPSIGLFWGPLVPASDNKPALFFMTLLQFATGTLCYHRARRIIKTNTFQSRFKTFLRASVPTIGGTTLVFGSGFEMMRLILPMDPWCEEAKAYRRIATAQGDKPSSWFGAYKYYKPMSLHDWISESKVFIVEREAEMSHSDKHSGILVKMNTNANYKEIYKKVSENNDRRFRELLEKDLSDVQEANRALRIDAVLDGTSKYVNPDFLKPPLTIGNHSIESDDDFDYAWLNFDPWDELKTEVESEIRMVPMCPDKLAEKEREEEEREVLK